VAHFAALAVFGSLHAASRTGVEAGLIRIEPWQGYAGPVDFTGELSTKEGMIPLAPGSIAKYSMRLFVKG
jgi:hypothetical protein